MLGLLILAAALIGGYFFGKRLLAHLTRNDAPTDFMKQSEAADAPETYSGEDLVPLIAEAQSEAELAAKEATETSGYVRVLVNGNELRPHEYNWSYSSTINPVVTKPAKKKAKKKTSKKKTVKKAKK
jgi:hypothetical protein